AVAARRQARVIRTLNISDMLVSVVSGPIVSCVQVEMVHVAYYPNVPVRVLLLFPDGQHLSLDTRADGHGTAVVRVRLHYVHADSPVRIGVQASDGTLGAHRMERAAVSMSLPQECQKVQNPTITIG